MRGVVPLCSEISKTKLCEPSIDGSSHLVPGVLRVISSYCQALTNLCS